jgi:protoporphyrinogen oxidase
LEATDRIGGISCTINHNGNRIDIGGHRFFSKSDKVMDWWTSRMPVQGHPASDDLFLGKNKTFSDSGPDPEKTDRVLLIRERISRIFYLRNFFDYPISLKPKTVFNLGVIRTIRAGFSYIYSQIFKRPTEDSLEDFLINRFGKSLYSMFFEDYTEKVWGVHPKLISSSWGAQRIKGLSLLRAIISAFATIFPKGNNFDIRQKNVETSLIEQFFYPKFGPGQMWESVADDIENAGGTILKRHKVVEIRISNNRILSVVAENDGIMQTFDVDFCISTMPICDFISAIKETKVPTDVLRVAQALPYRDFMTVGVLVDKLKINNDTPTPTLNSIIPDTWIYVQDREVKLCRLQIFNNWSPYMIADSSKVWIGLEYMCSELDDIWKMSDADFINFAIEELLTIGLIEKESIRDTCRIRIEKAYPAYFGSYNEFDKVKNYLNTINNLYCVGRNGQHRYNNQDHSMLTAMEAVDCIVNGTQSRESIWSVNTDQEYHEVRKS